MRQDRTQTYRAKGAAITGFPADRTALLVIDPVNDFREGGAAWDLTESTVKKNDVVGSLRRVIDGAHERGVAVLFAPMAYQAVDSGAAPQSRARRPGWSCHQAAARSRC